MNTVPSQKEGVLDCGLPYTITESRKKSPGLTVGVHYIATFKGMNVSIPELPKDAFPQLSGVAHAFAEQHALYPGGYRVAYNGPGVGRRNHAHIHIMFPTENEKLPTLVDTTET